MPYIEFEYTLKIVNHTWAETYLSQKRFISTTGKQFFRPILLWGDIELASMTIADKND